MTRTYVSGAKGSNAVEEAREGLLHESQNIVNQLCAMAQQPEINHEAILVKVGELVGTERVIRQFNERYGIKFNDEG